MIESKKWIIEIQNDSGEYAPYGWWKNDGKIHPYEYESKQAAFRVALNDLPKDCGNCRIVEKEQEGANP